MSVGYSLPDQKGAIVTRDLKFVKSSSRQEFDIKTVGQYNEA